MGSLQSPADYHGDFWMRVLVQWVLVIGLCCAGLLGQGVRRVSSSDNFPQGTSFQFSIEKAASSAVPVCPGGSILYQLTLTNQTTQASGDFPASLEDPIPPGTTYIAGSVSEGAFFDTGRNRVVWTGLLGASALQQSHSISFAVRINQGVADGTVITNVATAGGLPRQVFLQQEIELPLSVNCLPSTGLVTWTGEGNNNDFSDPNNWDPPVVPGPDHDAVIPASSGTIILPGSHEV